MKVIELPLPNGCLFYTPVEPTAAEILNEPLIGLWGGEVQDVALFSLR